MTEEAIGWEGLTAAADFFYAYTREYHRDMEESRFTPYTTLSALEISMGVLDTAWFWSVYNTLGRERYEKVLRHPRPLRIRPGYIADFGNTPMRLSGSIR